MVESVGQTLDKIAERIIVPLDVPTEEAAIALVQSIPQVTFWKVGLELFVSSGPAILKTLKSQNKKIFLDLKLHDIPNTMAGAANAVGRYGVDLLTVHAAAGESALVATQSAAEEGAKMAGYASPKVIAVTLLTSINSGALSNELQISVSVADYARRMAALAAASGLAGAVCSPHEAKQLRSDCGSSFLLVCPGVRPTWAQKGDQQRAMTPRQAMASGADYLVIGRPITQAKTPAAAFEKICQEIAV